MALANTICAGFIFKNEGKETDKTPVKWDIIQTAGAFTAAGGAAGNQDIISDLASATYEVRLMNLHVTMQPGTTAGTCLVTCAKDTIGDLNPGTTTNAAVTGNYNFGPTGMLIDITSTTACVAIVTAVTMGGYFYCQIAKRAK